MDDKFRKKHSELLMSRALQMVQKAEVIALPEDKEKITAHKEGLEKTVKEFRERK